MIPKGTVIFQEDPLSYVLNFAYLESHCDFCLKSGKLKKCSACFYVSYCDTQCQKQAWPHHRHECKDIQGLLETITDEVRLLARIIRSLKKQRNRDKFYRLESRIESFRCDNSRMNNFNRCYADLCKLMGLRNVPGQEELLEIYSRVNINACTLLDIHLRYVGSAIYSFPKTLKHSCKPNATYVHFGRTMIMTTIENLPELNWDEISVSFVDAMAEKKHRKVILKEKYYIECGCDKCMRPERNALCPNRDCRNACSIEEDRCPKCNILLTDDFKQKYKEVESMILASLDVEDYVEIDAKKSQHMIDKMREIFYSTHHLYMRMLEKAYIFEDDKQRRLRAINLLEELIIGYIYHYGYYNFATAVAYFKMAEQQLYYRNKSKTVKSIEKMREIIFFLFKDKAQAYLNSLRTQTGELPFL